MKVYVVQHEHELDDGSSDVKLIGVYASEATAQQACDRLRKLAGFKDHPDGFSVDPYEVGQDQWSEGFLTETIGHDDRTAAA